MSDSTHILDANILIVDDRRANITLLERLLRLQGYGRLMSTRDPFAVCELHKQHRFDLILLDLQMPDHDGFQVMNDLKEVECGGYLPVLAITVEPAYKLAALAGGAMDFIAKPFDYNELVNRIHNMLEVRLLYRQLEHRVTALKSFALHDVLTGLANRRLLMERLKQSRLSSARTHNHCALMYLDIDHFKLLNDTLGHEVGDLLLQQMALRLQQCVREGDCVARFGGDEFVLLLDALSPQPAEALKQAQTIADKVLKLLGQSYSLQGHAHDSSVSIGIHIFTGNTESQDQLLNKADLAMYRAKTMGRNTLCFYSPDMQAQAQAKENLIQTLCASLAGQELELYYQVQLDARGVPVGALASLHWRHALHGSMAEREINSLADEAGISLPLVQWTLQAACHQLQEWEQQPLTANWTLTLKISWGQLLQLDLGVILAAVTEKSSRCAKRLILELPGADMARYSDQGLELEDVIARMSALRATGLRFCLGDMGDGLPSLAALRRLPLAQLNLGPALLRSALRDNSVAVIARAMVELGRSLGLWVNATGIATVPEHDLVVAMGCNTLQGDLFGPAVLPLVLLRDLSKHSNAGTQWQDHEATK